MRQRVGQRLFCRRIWLQSWFRINWDIYNCNSCSDFFIFYWMFCGGCFCGDFSTFTKTIQLRRFAYYSEFGHIFNELYSEFVQQFVDFWSFWLVAFEQSYFYNKMWNFLYIETIYMWHISHLKSNVIFYIPV